MRIRFILLALAVLGLAFFQPVSAEAPGTVVKHVNYKDKTVTLELYRPEQGTRVVTIYQIDMGCIIKLDGVVVKLGKIHKGLHVTGMTEGEPKVLDAIQFQSY